jgi:hypothetical protein
VDLDRHHFFIGRDTASGEPLIYEADNLTTHGVIVGMTGSGKTGLGIGLIEEALLGGIPCLVIDPKGDMGNLALIFPDLHPDSFEPWIDPVAASKAGKTTADLAAETAQRWQMGLEGDDIGADRIARLDQGAEVTIYTPGSEAGVGLNVLGSMKAPDLSWDTEAEVIRDEIQSLVSSLLTLVGVDSDPVSGPEHILLSTILETLWRQGTDLDLASLVGQIPNPPFRKLGVFEVDAFIPAKDRMALALKLNGLLASPSFASWMKGVPLEIERLIGGSGPTKAAIVYLAHLSDEERQFLVTLLLSKMVTWIRSQSGTSQLRALIYMDEMFGFAPPTAQPPSKKPILTILKQARAHGVGMVLSTQNPVDLDYKAMSNAGTWMIGRLQTENDKRRILEGLASATGGVDVGNLSRLISTLEKRQFVLHMTKANEPRVFSTRWVMSYMAGPLTRGQVSSLMREKAAAASPSADRDASHADDVVPVPPKVAQGRVVSFLDPAAPWASQVGADPTGTTLEAAIAARVRLLYDDTSAGIEHQEEFEAVLFPRADRLDEVIAVDHDDRDFRPDPPAGVEYRIPDVDLGSVTSWKSIESELKDYLVAHLPIRVFRNPGLKLYSRVDETEEDFASRCDQAAENAADAALAKLKDRYKTRIGRVRDQIQTAETRLILADQEAAAKQQSELISGAGELLGTFIGGRSRSNPLGSAASRRAATQKARARAGAEASKLTAREREMVALEDELAEAVTDIVTKHREMAKNIEEIEIPLEKTDISVDELKLVWIPLR